MLLTCLLLSPFMADFTAYLPMLFANEGNYCDNYPADQGGETFRGIARNPNPNWAGWAVVDTTKARLELASPVPMLHWAALSNELLASPQLTAAVESFYIANFWNVLRLGEVTSQSIADQLADHGINAGTRRTAMMLQYLLATEFGAALAVDGEVGTLTIQALNGVVPPLFYLRLVEMRRAFYTYLAGGSPTPGTEAWTAFFHGHLGMTHRQDLQQFLSSWLVRTQYPFVA